MEEQVKYLDMVTLLVESFKELYDTKVTILPVDAETFKIDLNLGYAFEYRQVDEVSEYILFIAMEQMYDPFINAMVNGLVNIAMVESGDFIAGVSSDEQAKASYDDHFNRLDALFSGKTNECMDVLKNIVIEVTTPTMSVKDE